MVEALLMAHRTLGVAALAVVAPETVDAAARVAVVEQVGRAH